MSASNVVRLPTAARRKVQQYGNKHTRATMKAMRAEWPGLYISPQVRAKIPDAAALLALERTPELLLSLAIFQALDETQRKFIRNQCEIMKGTGLPARSAAVAVQVRTIGDCVNLDAACSVIREHGDELAR